MGLFFKKSKNDDFIKPPIRVEPSNETMTFDEGGEAKMTIEDVFFIKGRGTVITGHIDSGTFRVGQKITIQTANGDITTTITGIESFHKHHDFATAGNNVGMVLDKVSRESVKHGDIVSAE